MEMFLLELIGKAHRMKFQKPSVIHRVTVDITVQDKAVSYPTGGKLYNKGHELLVQKAQEDCGLPTIGFAPEPQLCRDDTGELVNKSLPKIMAKEPEL
jgi:hypothetical protein